MFLAATFFFSPGLSRCIWSPLSLMILSVSSPTLSPVPFKCIWHTSIHLVFGGPPFLLPGTYQYISSLNTFLSMCSSSLLITRPYQFNHLSVIFLEAFATLVVPRMCSFLIVSLRVTPHPHLVHLNQFLAATKAVYSSRSKLIVGSLWQTQLFSRQFCHVFQLLLSR